MLASIPDLRALSFAGVIAAVLLACGGPGGSVDANADTSPAPGETPSQPCAATDLCLETRSVRPDTAPLGGLLVVVWAQLSDDGPDPVPKVTYSVPFTGKQTRITIPLAAIGAPDEPNRFCMRACTDEASCPCTSKERPGIAYVGVIADANGNGTADLDYEMSAEPVIGAADIVLVQSDDEIEIMPAELGTLFPDGVRAGTHPYVVDPTGTNGRPELRPAPGKTFELSVCDTQVAADCSQKFPDLH
jgi:hypothetical protein